MCAALQILAQVDQVDQVASCSILPRGQFEPKWAKWAPGELCKVLGRIWGVMQVFAPCEGGTGHWGGVIK